MRNVCIIACWIAVLAAGIFLRFDNLSARPFHADEATGARITAQRMEEKDYRFDPLHYHGPLLSSLAIPLFEMRGETGWQKMTKETPRLLAAISGSLLLLVPLLWRRRVGDIPILLAAALLATSPLLVYYSRMFIHESLLVLFGVLALVAIIRAPKYGIAGLWIGLMFATKETFAISIIAWAAAGGLVLLGDRQSLQPVVWREFLRKYGISIGISLMVAAVVSAYFYTDGFRQPRGAIDAVRTYFVYETVGGHDKPFGYYFRLLVLPFRSGGLWWFGTPVVVLAVVAWLTHWRRGSPNRNLVLFLGYAAVGHFLIYSMIGYKTPWLACLPWAHVCLLAGFATSGLQVRPRWAYPVVCLVAGLCVVSQFRQARSATGRMASDERNPFAYVPTQRDVESLSEWLTKLAAVLPDGAMEPVTVVGGDYWPLPWYLRQFDQIGYWPEAPEDLESKPLVMAMPEMEGAVAARISETHTYLPRGLRAGVPLGVFLRNDLFELWMKDGK